MSNQGQVLATVPLFARMSEPALEQLAQASRVRHYPAGQVLWHEGDPGDTLLVLEAGRLRVSRVGPDAQEAILAIIEAVAALGELALLDGAPRDATVIALRDVTVRFVPRQAFLQVLRREPNVVEQLIKTLAEMVRAANARHEQAISRDVPGRLSAWLADRAARTGRPFPDGSMEIALGRSQGELAAELWTTRSTLNRALRQIESTGAIKIDGDAVLILDLASLKSNR